MVGVEAQAVAGGLAPRPPALGLAALAPWRAAPVHLLLPGGCTLREGSPASGLWVAHLTASKPCSPPSCPVSNPSGLFLPWPSARGCAFCSQPPAGCQAVGLRNAGWPQLPGVCVLGRVGRRWRRTAWAPGLTLREGRASQVCDTTPGVHWPSKVVPGLAFCPDQQQLLSVGDAIFLGHSGSHEGWVPRQERVSPFT